MLLLFREGAGARLVLVQDRRVTTCADAPYGVTYNRAATMRRPRPLSFIPIPGLDPHRDEPLFKEVLAEVEALLQGGGPLRPELRLFTDTGVWQVPIEHLLWPGQEPATAGIFSQAGEPGVLRRFRFGTMGRPDALEAVVLEILPPRRPNRYRTAVRRISLDGRFRPREPWRCTEHASASRMGGTLWRQVDPFAPPPEMRWGPGGKPPILTATRPSSLATRGDPVSLAKALLEETLQGILANPEPCLDAFLLLPDLLEHWVIRKGLQCTVHDALRNLAAGRDVRGIVLVEGTIIETGRHLAHGLVFAAEAEGHRGGMTVPLPTVSAGGQLVKATAFRQPAPHWLGVPPKVKFDIWPAGEVH